MKHSKPSVSSGTSAGMERRKGRGLGVGGGGGGWGGLKVESACHHLTDKGQRESMWNLLSATLVVSRSPVVEYTTAVSQHAVSSATAGQGRLMFILFPQTDIKA